MSSALNHFFYRVRLRSSTSDYRKSFQLWAWQALFPKAYCWTRGFASVRIQKQMRIWEPYPFTSAGFCSAKYRCVSLECTRIHLECFTQQAWPTETLCFIHCIFSSFCLQKTNNFLSKSSKIPVETYPWDVFFIWDKKTTKSLQNSICFSLTVWAPVSIANVCAKYDSRG